MRQNVPDHIKEFIDRAQEFEREKQYNQAIAIYRQGLALHPDNAVLHNNLGCCLANQEQYEEAKNEFQQAIVLTPVNRQVGIITPEGYPQEPEQNLRAAQARINGTCVVLLPARSGFDPFHPGMGYPEYLLWFILRNPLGWLLSAISVIGIGVLWKNNSPHYPTAIGISCFVILVIAFIYYTRDPRLRR